MNTSTPFTIRITHRHAPRQLEPKPASDAAQPPSTGMLPRPADTKPRVVLHLHRPAHTGHVQH